MCRGSATASIRSIRVRRACWNWFANSPRAASISGRFADIAEAVEAEVARRKGKKIPLNIDGATAVIYGELGFPPPLTRGLFVLSRSVGILAHAWEQSQQADRNKGPLPREWLWAYTGTPVRPFPEEGDAGE